MERKDLKGILYLGWIHHANLRGLQWLCQKLSLELREIRDESEIDSYPGFWLVLAMNKLVPNIHNDKLVISGPHLLPHDVPNIQENDHTLNTPTPATNISMPTLSKYKYIWNTLSEWNKNLTFELKKPLKCICAPFPVTYDIPELTPSNSTERNKIIVYFKQRPYDLLHTCRVILNELVDPTSIEVFTYGNYNYNTWTESLKRAKFVIFLIATESQGFAVQEAMSLDVPMVMWDVTELHQVNVEPRWFERPEYPQHISATGVTIWDSKSCGIRVSDYESFTSAVQMMNQSYTSYHPRPFLIRNFEPEQCLNRFLNE